MPVRRVWRSITFILMQINSPLCPYAASLLNANEKVFRDHGFIHFTHNMRARSRRAFNNQTHSASGCLVATTGIIKRGLLQSETRSKFSRTVFLSMSMPVFIDRMKACFYSFGFPLTSFYCFLLSKPSTSKALCFTSETADTSPRFPIFFFGFIVPCWFLYSLKSSELQKAQDTLMSPVIGSASLYGTVSVERWNFYDLDEKKKDMRWIKWSNWKFWNRSWSVLSCTFEGCCSRPKRVVVVVVVYLNKLTCRQPSSETLPFSFAKCQALSKKDLKWAQMKMKSECWAFEHGAIVGTLQRHWHSCPSRSLCLGAL